MSAKGEQDHMNENFTTSLGGRTNSLNNYKVKSQICVWSYTFKNSPIPTKHVFLIPIPTNNSISFFFPFLYQSPHKKPDEFIKIFILSYSSTSLSHHRSKPSGRPYKGHALDFVQLPGNHHEARGRHIQTTFKAHQVDEKFYKTEGDINWIIHEAEQHLFAHPMVRLLDTQDRRIRSEKVTFSYMPEGSHSGIHIDPLSRIHDNPPPTKRRESRDWDKDPEGRQSPTTVHL